jgi:hypothetical protein
VRGTDAGTRSGMTASAQHAIVEPGAPGRVRPAFWVMVAVLWAMPLTLVGVVVAVVLLGGSPSKVLREVTPGMTADEVRRRVGSPSATFADATSWQSLAAQTKGCGQSVPPSTAWLYTRFVQDDSMVFFDAAQRVLCVHECGKSFHVRSH